MYINCCKSNIYSVLLTILLIIFLPYNSYAGPFSIVNHDSIEYLQYKDFVLNYVNYRNFAKPKETNLDNETKCRYGIGLGISNIMSYEDIVFNSTVESLLYEFSDELIVTGIKISNKPIDGYLYYKVRDKFYNYKRLKYEDLFH